jgi:flagellar protein FliO/FliZ
MAGLLAIPALAQAADEAGRGEAVASTLPGGGMLAQLTLGLMVVLALAVGLSWLLRRYALPRDGLIRVAGGLPLGHRERLLLVEVDNTRLLLGITPTQIQTLHVFAPATAETPTPTFQLPSLAVSEMPREQSLR